MDSQTYIAKGIQGLSQEMDWDAVYANLEPRIYNFFRYRIGEDLTAQDLTSVTFEKAWRGRIRFRRNLGAFSTWIFTIARNTAIDYFRQNRLETPLDEDHDLVDPASVEDAVQHRQEFSHLSSILERMSTRDRELIALKYGGRLTNREIAKLTHFSESNVGAILSRTIQKLREEWEEADER
jgi:RNA polymerase sigma-70 factor, ECF subfamily